ncbi:MAG: inositol monophosphatase family protein, partial [Acidimicrobiia bacterium]|nr:inositol monophosphatase family protein [Acidimicrobiia bacterium]
MSILESALDVGRDAVRRAAQVCLGVLAEAPAAPDAMAKLGKEPVTIADYGSQAVVLEAVSRMFPDHAVVAEEGSAHLVEHAGDDGAEQIVRLVGDALRRTVDLGDVAGWIDHTGRGGDLTWVIDPIDGTKGFLRRQQFAIAVGLLADGEVVGGVLGCPHFGGGTLYWAGRGLGAWAEGLHGGASRRVSVSDTDVSGARTLGSVESAHGDPALVTAVVDHLDLGGGMVRIDSQVKYGAVADGQA